jgi:hypothetical protein
VSRHEATTIATAGASIRATNKRFVVMRYTAGPRIQGSLLVLRLRLTIVSDITGR